MRAILVSVEYDDLLAVSLPYNRHHFDEVMVVTSSVDTATQEVAAKHNAQVFITNAFYDDGAQFNKWKALELGLDAFGREGLMCIMDADILWPKEPAETDYEHGFLYSPRRRVQFNTFGEFLDEKYWHTLGTYRDNEFAGYTQIFYADDPVLPQGHWHEENWLHAGGADSVFQNLWPNEKKIRPFWEVLHLGIPGQNWTGRSSVRRDNTMPAEYKQRKASMRRFMAARIRLLQQGASDPYAAEKLPAPQQP